MTNGAPVRPAESAVEPRFRGADPSVKPQGGYGALGAVCGWCLDGDHTPEQPHTWMDSEDLTRASQPTPDSRDGWAALARTAPCACHCNPREDTRD